MKRTMHPLALCVAVLAAGCGEDTVPIPLLDPFPSELPPIELGMSARVLTEMRETLGLEPRIGYQDYLSPASWIVYEFRGTGEDTPPPPTSPLYGVQSVRTGRDSVRALAEWHRLIGVATDSLGVTPTCFAFEERWARHIRAEWGDTLRLTLSLLIEGEPDGIEYNVESMNRFGFAFPDDPQHSGDPTPCPTPGI